jgi:hypothetical protein
VLAALLDLSAPLTLALTDALELRCPPSLSLVGVILAAGCYSQILTATIKTFPISVVHVDFRIGGCPAVVDAARRSSTCC